MNTKSLTQFAATLGLALLSTTVAPALTLCGTFAAPTSCSVTTSGNITYTYSNFSLPTNTGQGQFFAPSVFGISIDTPSATQSSITIAPTVASGLSSYFVAPGSSTSTVFSYDVTIAPALPGSVAFTSTYTGQANISIINNATATVQFSPATTTCAAPLANAAITCTFPSGTTTSVTPESISMILVGNSGVASVSSITSTFNATFTADPGNPSGVPEPSSIALFFTGVAALAWRRFRSTE